MASTLDVVDFQYEGGLVDYLRDQLPRLRPFDIVHSECGFPFGTGVFEITGLGALDV